MLVIGVGFEAFVPRFWYRACTESGVCLYQYIKYRDEHLDPSKQSLFKQSFFNQSTLSKSKNMKSFITFAILATATFVKAYYDVPDGPDDYDSLIAREYGLE